MANSYVSKINGHLLKDVEARSRLTALENRPSGSGGGAIIDVAELPTTDINENVIYRIADRIDGQLVLGNSVYWYANFAGMSLTIFAVESAESYSNKIPCDDTNLYFYIDTDSGIAYVDYSGMTLTAGQLMGSLMDDTISDGGWTTNIENEAVPDGYGDALFFFKPTAKYYAYKNGGWTELSNSTSGDTSGGRQILTIVDVDPEGEGGITLSPEVANAIKNNFVNTVLHVYITGNFWRVVLTPVIQAGQDYVYTALVDFAGVPQSYQGWVRDDGTGTLGFALNIHTMKI